MSFALAPYLVSGSISLYLGYKSLKNYYNQPFEYLELEAQEIEELGSLETETNMPEGIVPEGTIECKSEDEEIINKPNDEVINKISDKIVFNVLENVNKENKDNNEDMKNKEDNDNTQIGKNKKFELLKQKNLDKYEEKYPNKLDIGLISMDNFDGRKVLPPIGSRPKVGVLPPIGETKELDFVELKPTVYIPKKNKNKKNKRKNKQRK